MVLLGGGKGFSLESTADRIKTARKEQLAARAAGNAVVEKVWTEAIHRLLDTYMGEIAPIDTNQ
jgi:hypothetical protein